MSIKSTVATWTGKSAYWFLHTFRGGGSSLPGKLALKLDPAILKQLAKNYDVIVITGTNGKTLTTALTVKVLGEQYPDILTNPSGSNMKQGIVTTFLTAPKAHQKPLAVLEVDEANVIMVTKYITPKAFVFTNIFRDQMDRYGEIYTTYQKILDGVALAPDATIIANGDLPLLTQKRYRILFYIMVSIINRTVRPKPQRTRMACCAPVVSIFCTITAVLTAIWASITAPIVGLNGHNSLIN